MALLGASNQGQNQSVHFKVHLLQVEDAKWLVVQSRFREGSRRHAGKIRFGSFKYKSTICALM